MAERNDKDPVIEFIDRQGRPQKGTLVELLSSKDKGVVTVQDATALAFYDLALRIKQQEEDNPDKP